MPAPALDIRGSGTSWAILREGVQVAGPYSSYCNAISALRGVEQRLDPSVVRIRRCRCGDTYLARKGETLCPDCKGNRHG